MGFRTVMMTADRPGIEVPAGFFEKYDFLQGVKNEETGKFYLPIASTVERKFYDTLEDTEVFKDLQELLNKSQYSDLPIVLILLHECDGITKVEIHKDKIVGMEPTAWKKVDAVTHDYCYGCSDYKNIPGDVERWQGDPIFPPIQNTGEALIDNIIMPGKISFSASALEPAEPLTEGDMKFYNLIKEAIDQSPESEHKTITDHLKS